MKISYNQLLKYVDFKLSAPDLGEVLTGVGLEVEHISLFETIKGSLQGVVVGEVVECAKHPDADKLSLTKVNIGSEELLQIVCGAPNVAAGQKVLVATVGATIYPTQGDAITIKKAKIRGVESRGMICAEDELGLGNSHDGILVLPPHVAVGTPAADYFGISTDQVFDIGLTPNRGDANSHIGVARDVAAALNVAYKSPVSFTKPDVSGFEALPKADSTLNIEVEKNLPADCIRYSGISISGVAVKESPEWLKNFLRSIGVKPINNIVDITNYILHEYGQPLHAFDADAIMGKRIVVQHAKPGSEFICLDGSKVKLSGSELMIANEQAPMCIAGVYGGANSGVTATTTNLFIESACFDAVSVRKTYTLHNLRTDSATHFEKGTDPNGTVEALKRATLLIAELAGGKVASGITDVYPSPVKPREITVSVNRINKLLGFEMEASTITNILTRLEFGVQATNADTLQLSIPTFKTEVTREADVLEEILRIYGYNSFTLPSKLNTSLSFSPKVQPHKVENNIASFLTGFGFNEILTNSVSKSKYVSDEAELKGMVKLLNSQTVELDSLRTGLLFSVLEVIKQNSNHKQSDLRLYEFGKSYHKGEQGYFENKHLAIAITGKYFTQNWIQQPAESDFFHLKTVVDQMLQKLGHHAFTRTVAEGGQFDFALRYSNEETTIVTFGKVSSAICNNMDIKAPVFFADFNWDYLLERSAFHKLSYKELNKFPSIKRDLSMIVDDALTFESIETIAEAESKKLLQEVSLFDVYKGKNIEAGKKSYAVSFTFKHAERTLTDADVDKVMNKLMAKLESELKVAIRKN